MTLPRARQPRPSLKFKTDLDTLKKNLIRGIALLGYRLSIGKSLISLLLKVDWRAAAEPWRYLLKMTIKLTPIKDKWLQAMKQVNKFYFNQSYVGKIKALNSYILFSADSKMKSPWLTKLVPIRWSLFYFW